MAKKKEEPAKPAATQLIFQAPSLPTPKVERATKKKAEPKPERKEKKKKEAPKEKTKPQKAAAKEEDGSTRVEAKRIRRRDSRDTGRRRSTVTES